MHQVVLLIGGNTGDREHLINQAKSSLSDIGEIAAQSKLYETEPWGNASEGSFLNQALLIKTFHSPKALLQLTQNIEKQLGRTRDIHWGNRTMDIDIIYIDDLVLKDEDLLVPHPLMSERNFVLVPLVDVLPHFIHPVYKISNTELLLKCADNNKVKLYKSL